MKKKCSFLVNAKVVDNVTYGKSGDGIYYHPVFEYVIDNKKYTDTYFGGTSNIKYKVGDEVEIYCDPNNYKKYYIKDDTLSSKVSLFLIGFGILFVAVSFCLILFYN